jgi:hypothetical protein
LHERWRDRISPAIFNLPERTGLVRNHDFLAALETRVIICGNLTLNEGGHRQSSRLFQQWVQI